MLHSFNIVFFFLSLNVLELKYNLLISQLFKNILFVVGGRISGINWIIAPSPTYSFWSSPPPQGLVYLLKSSPPSPLA